ncbi:hypothetical protein [Rhizobium sp. J15]|uniref:hypothetical protein n=1 Tax=Rhizobium sp. J15 TaxID=2035450 RepID=UPI001FE0FD8F|nr:hypothetical protein [Rhizobium sp. J15]
MVLRRAFASSAHALTGVRLAASEAYRKIRFNRWKEGVDDMAMPFVRVVIDFIELKVKAAGPAAAAHKM